jgi:hypothetical protein
MRFFDTMLARICNACRVSACSGEMPQSGRGVPQPKINLLKGEDQNNFNKHVFSPIQQTTRNIVIFIEKYLRDYNNSHIFAMKD